MAFIEKQMHGKHAYYYLVKSVRISPASVKKIRIFLGRQVPDHAELQKHFAELEKKAPKPYSVRWISKEDAERLEDLRASSAAFKEAPGASLPKDFLVRFTYNTNAIEGNPLTLRQTALVLAEGIAPQGARAQDVIEALNSKDAWEFARGYRGSINKGFICRLQYEVTKNTDCTIQGAYRKGDVGITGAEWNPPKASELPSLMEGFIKDCKKQKKSLHPAELAAWFHNRLVQIHPFTDGNGRTARLLMNWVLMRARFPPLIIEVRNKEAYYRMIEEADYGKQEPFARFLASELLRQYTLPKAGGD